MSEKNVTELENLILEIEHHIVDLENASIKDNLDRNTEIRQLKEKRKSLQIRLCSN